jgi:hypothetical protein
MDHACALPTVSRLCVSRTRAWGPTTLSNPSVDRTLRAACGRSPLVQPLQAACDLQLGQSRGDVELLIPRRLLDGGGDWMVGGAEGDPNGEGGPVVDLRRALDVPTHPRRHRLCDRKRRSRWVASEHESVVTRPWSPHVED